MGERNMLIKLLGDASNLKSAFKDAGGGAEGMGGVFDKMKGKLAAALTVGAVVKFGTDSVQAYEHVAGATAKLQRLTGGTAEDMSRLSFEAKETGVSQETLEKSLTKVSKAMAGNNKAFDQYGIATKDAHGNLRPLNDVMGDAAEVFSKMHNGAEKNALAMQLFGKSGTDMIPMLNKGRDGLAELSKESDKFGLTMGQGSVDAYKKHVAESRKMHAAMEGLKVQIGEKLAPILYKFASFMAENLPKAIEFVKRVIEGLKPTFQAIGEWIAELVDWWKAHWDQIRDTVTNVVGYISGFIQTVLAGIEAFWRTFGSNVMAFLQGWVDGLVGLIQGLWDVIVGIFDLFRDLFTGKWGKLWGDVLDILTGVWTAIKGVVTGFVEEIEAILSAAWTIVSGAVSAAWDGMKSVVSGVIDGIVGFVEGLPGRAVSALSSLGSGLASLGSLAIHALWDAMTAAWDAGWSFITGIPGKIVSELSSIGSDLATVFGKIPGAIWSAFKSAWNTVANIATFNIPQVTIPMPPGVDDLHFGGGSVSLLPHLHTGGIIPGLTGEEVLVVARAGERVQTPGQAANDSGSGLQQVNHFYGITDQRELARHQAREIGWQLRAA